MKISLLRVSERERESRPLAHPPPPNRAAKILLFGRRVAKTGGTAALGGNHGEREKSLTTTPKRKTTEVLGGTVHSLQAVRAWIHWVREGVIPHPHSSATLVLYLH